jgi:uncharacterized protein YacL
MQDTIQTLLLLGIAGYLYKQRIPNAAKIPKSTKKIILDTCALIDGRILELSKLGFVPDVLVIPQFIIHELQMLADGNDAHKRERARYGLDVVRELQASKSCEVVIDQTNIEGRNMVDDKLVALAKKLNAPLYTTDFNLNKVADIEGIKVLNVNELAQNLRPVALPGERKEVKIVQKGSNADQGVGYLDDGTMVVIDRAAQFLGKKVSAEVTRVHQTVAGKMLFADLVAAPKAVPAATKSALRQQKPVLQKTSALRRRLRTR